MNKHVRFILAGLMLIALVMPGKVCAANWTDDVLNPDTLWYTDHKNETVYTLTTPEELAGLSVLVNTYNYTMSGKTIRLGNDISLQKSVDSSPVLWTPIGYYERNKRDIRFQGTFDGAGFAIDYLIVNTETPTNGLFGATLNADIRNVVIGSHSSVASTRECTAAIAGYAENSRFVNCTNHAQVSAVQKANINRVAGVVGGMAGKCYVSMCYNTGRISDAECCGGIVGATSANDTIVNSINTGVIRPGYGYYAGGIVGYPYNKTVVMNCLNEGQVDGENCTNTGGIFGLSYNVTVRNCVNVGEVKGNKTSIGTIGGGTQSTYTGSRNFALQGALIATPGTGSPAATILTPEQIKSQTFVTELSDYAGYLNCTDLTKATQLNKWKYVANTYPGIDLLVSEDTYKATVTPTELGDIAMGVLSADDATSSYFAAGTQVTLPVTAYDGYTFTGITIDGSEQADNNFEMPAHDVTVVANFNAGAITTWAEMAQHAVTGIDYKLNGYTYEILSAKGLAYVASQINGGHTDEETIISLTADIDLGVANVTGDILLWIPAGTETNKFNGIFDGKGFTINNMIINTTAKYAGLFGYADGAELKHVSIAANSSVEGAEQYTAALAGYVVGTKMINCHNAAPVKGVKNNIGGLTGCAGAGSTISYCSNSGKIASETSLLLGGIAGALGDNKGASQLYNSFNTGVISAKQTVGGLVGNLQTPTTGTSKSMIVNCYNAGTISAVNSMAGGITGMINKNSEVKNCVNYATVTTSVRAGGIVGSIAKDGVVIRNYYQAGTVTGSEISADGAALTEEQMKGKDLPNELSVFAGYINNVELTDYLQWTYTANQYPVLDAKNTKATAAYLLTVADAANGTAVLTAPAAILATDSTAIFVKKNTVVTFSPAPEDTYLFYALRVNDVQQTEYSNTFRTGAEDTHVEVLFSRPRRWDFLAPNAVAGTDYTENATGYDVHTNLGLAWIADKVNAGDAMQGKVISLTADIELGEKNIDGELISWAPIGNSSSKQFKGNFNGNSFSVKDMVVNAPTGYGGLFGYAVSDTIANVSVTGKSAVSGTTNLGAIAGYINTNAVILNCNNDSCSVTGSASNAGGIVGSAGSGCRVVNTSNTGTVTSTSVTGGIAGYLQGKVENSLNTGSVVTTNKGGGIIGDGYNPTVTRSYRLETCVSGAVTENTNGTGLAGEKMNTQSLADELTAFAGYLNRTESFNLTAWSFTEGYSPASGSEKAAEAYTVTLVEAENGTVALPAVLAADNASFMACTGSTVELSIAADAGFVLSSLKANDTDITANPNFVMPGEDVTVTAEFEAFVPKTWADMAPQAVNGVDYVLATENEYEINTALGLAYAASLVNEAKVTGSVVFTLKADLDLGVKNTDGETLLWIPAGTDVTPFKGTLDGNRHLIDNMLVVTDSKYAGLFGYADGADISNVVIGAGSSVTSSEQYAAAVVAYANNTMITACENNGTVMVTANKLYSGGITAAAFGTTKILSCVNTGAITTAGGTVGGIAGALGNTTSVSELADCFNKGIISAEKNSAGGLVGMMQGNRSGTDTSVWVTITNSVNSGTVSAASMSGGIVGFMGALSVKNCVNYGAVSAAGGKATVYAGAISGYLNNSVAKNGGCVFFRNYTLQDCVSNEGGTIIEDSKTELNAEQLSGAALINELTLHAGYLNRAIEGGEFAGWKATESGIIYPGAAKAEDAYAVIVDESTTADAIDMGSVSLPEMISVNDSVYYTSADSKVVLTVASAANYQLEWLKANDVEITTTDHSFTMPAEDVTVTVAFSLITGINSESADGKRVWTSASTLHVAVTDAALIAITGIDGQMLLKEQAVAGEHSYSLPEGFYLVNVGGTTFKVRINR